MATKDELFFKKEMQKQFFFNNDSPTDNRNLNLNSNQISKCLDLSSSVHSFNKSNNNKKFDFSLSEKDGKVNLHSWNKSTTLSGDYSNNSNFSNFYDGSERESKNYWKNKESSKKNTTTKSTLSLYIEVYENSVENDTVTFDDFEGLKKNKGFINSIFVFQNPFEFPRQQENDKNKKPEIAQFKASQKLLGSKPFDASQAATNAAAMSRQKIRQQKSDPEEKTFETFSTTKGTTTTENQGKGAAAEGTRKAPPTIYPDVTKTCDKMLSQNPVERVEHAQQLAIQSAQFRDGTCIRSIGYGYKITKELTQSCFGFTYEAIQVETCKKVWIKSEPMTDDETMKKFKTLKNELLIMQQILKANPSQCEHFVRLLDSGCTDQFKFLVTEYLGDNLYTITRMYLNNGFSKSTALRVSIQMLRSIIDLHALGYIHRFIKPHIYAIGIGPSQIKTIHLFDFSLAFSYRDKAGKVLRPRRKVKILGALRYTSRHSHLNQELSRRDDLESWLYLSLEFFYLNVLPWRGDQISASVLYKKQKLFDGDFSRVFKKVPEEYSVIMKYINKLKYSETPDYPFIMNQLEQARITQNIDFSLPYDWEDLTNLLLKKSQREENPEKIELKPPPPENKATKSPSSADCEPKVEAKSDVSSSRIEPIAKFQATPNRAIDDLIDVSVSSNGKNRGSQLVQKVHLDLLRKKPPPPPPQKSQTTHSTSKERISDDL